MGTILLHSEHSGQVGRIVLNAPKANILDQEMIGALSDAFQELGRSPQTKLVTVEGAGKHFSFGASVEEHQAEPCKKMIPAFMDLFQAIIDSRLPTLALVRGQCLGGGMELAVWCNWLIAAPDAMFAQPEIQLGVFAPLASLLLPLRCGQAAADDLCLTGRVIDAAEAARLGLAGTVAPDVETAAQAFIHEHILPKSATSLRIANHATRHHLHRAFEKTRGWLEALYLDELMHTADANEGISAFMEKRPPVWQNS